MKTVRMSGLVVCAISVLTCSFLGPLHSNDCSEGCEAIDCHYNSFLGNIEHATPCKDQWIMQNGNGKTSSGTVTVTFTESSGGGSLCNDEAHSEAGNCSGDGDSWPGSCSTACEDS